MDVVEENTFSQLNELIEQYQACLSTLQREDARVRYFRGMLEAMYACRKYLMYENKIPGLLLRYRQRNMGGHLGTHSAWYITFVFFYTAFEVVIQGLQQLGQQESMQEIAYPRDKTEYTKLYQYVFTRCKIGKDYARPLDLLYSLGDKLFKQHYFLELEGRSQLTTYRGRTFLSTYGGSIEFINATLLFAILRDIGHLFIKLT